MYTLIISLLAALWLCCKHLVCNLWPLWKKQKCQQEKIFPWVIPPSIIITSLCWKDAQRPVYATLQRATCSTRPSPETLIDYLLSPWVLLIRVFSLCLPVCRSVFRSVHHTPFSPRSYRVVSLFRAVRSMSCLSIKMSPVATYLKLFQVSWHGDKSVI